MRVYLPFALVPSTAEQGNVHIFEAVFSEFLDCDLIASVVHFLAFTSSTSQQFELQFHQEIFFMSVSVPVTDCEVAKLHMVLTRLGTAGSLLPLWLPLVKTTKKHGTGNAGIFQGEPSQQLP